ncbi:MAG TPA: hypothetical protein VEM41_13215 [Actinomycetota bacterium]|nr:hypothetical protein [Actinomycetota bacterium]
MPRILVATADGIHELDANGEALPTQLEGRSVTAVASQRGGRWAIVDGAEVWRCAEGRDWTRVAAADGDHLTCLAPTAAGVLAGSAGAHLFRVDDATIEPVASFDDAEGRDTWHTPWGGPPDTRSLSEWDESIYVNVHVGGILRTEDGGATWTPTIDIDADVHQVATAEGMALAACAGGLATSPDRGKTWDGRAEGLEASYSRAVAVCGELVLVSASRGPRGGRSAVYRGGLARGSFERCRNGLPEWFDDNVDTYCLDSLPDGSFAAFGTADATVFASEDAGATWAEVARGLESVRQVLVTRDPA